MKWPETNLTCFCGEIVIGLNSRQTSLSWFDLQQSRRDLPLSSQSDGWIYWDFVFWGDCLKINFVWQSHKMYFTETLEMFCLSVWTSNFKWKPKILTFELLCSFHVNYRIRWYFKHHPLCFSACCLFRVGPACLLPSLAFALPRVLTCSSNNTEILLRFCISVNVLHIKDISEKILYIKERNLTKKIRGSKGQGKCWTKSVV